MTFVVCTHERCRSQRPRYLFSKGTTRRAYSFGSWSLSCWRQSHASRSGPLPGISVANQPYVVFHDSSRLSRSRPPIRVCCHAGTRDCYRVSQCRGPRLLGKRLGSPRKRLQAADRAGVQARDFSHIRDGVPGIVRKGWPVQSLDDGQARRAGSKSTMLFEGSSTGPTPERVLRLRHSQARKTAAES